MLANENVCVTSNRNGLFISYNSLFDFYKTGTYYVEGHRKDGNNHYLTYKCGPYTLSSTKRDLIAWEILGRVVHLLGDMGVPAHAHNDLHILADSYEDSFMHPSTAIYFNESLAFQNGGMIDVNNKNSPLRYLFYTVNQVADWFHSDGSLLYPDYGDNNYSSSFGGDTYSELVSKMQALGTPHWYNWPPSWEYCRTCVYNEYANNSWSIVLVC